MRKLITYHGSNDTLVWHKDLKGLKSDCELIVPISHEAVFIKNNIMAGSYSGGRFIFNECAVGENKLFVNDGEQVDCRVYFVKREGTYNIKWELSPLSVNDAVLKMPVEFNLSGVFGLNIIEVKTFLSRILTFTKKATLDEVKCFFRERMLLHIKSELIAALSQQNLSVIELPNKLMSVSKEIELSVRHLFESFGVCVVGFLLKKFELLSVGNKKISGDNSEADAAKNAKEKSVEAATAECLYCSACGTDVPPLSLFCNKCGAKIVQK